MKLVLDNAQHTPHISLLDEKRLIKVVIDICSDGVLINGKSLSESPEKDDIVLYRGK